MRGVGDLQGLIEAGEGERLEFCRSPAPEAIARAVCAFLNTDGGKVVVGVSSEGRITGVPKAEVAVRQIETELTKLISPPARWTIEGHHVDGRDVLLIEVPEGSDKPYIAAGAIYVRRGDRVASATRDVISQLIQRRSEASYRWERQIALGMDRGDLDDDLVRETVRLAAESHRWQGSRDDSGRFLSALGLISDGGVTNAGVVLYGKDPCRLLPQARVRVLVMPEGKTGNLYESDRLFEKCLLRTAKEIPEALAIHLGGVESRFSNMDWRRSDRSIYPMAAVREGVMNALVHRDYGMSGSTTISVLPDSLRISNPGGLPDELKPADLKRDHASLPRNPDIAHVCFLHGLIEKIGRGTQRIVEDCRTARLPEPRWQSSRLETTLTLFSARGRLAARPIELNDRQERIWATLKERGQLRPREIAKITGAEVTERTVRSDLQRMVDGGWLVRRGRGRSVSYVAEKNRGP